MAALSPQNPFRDVYNPRVIRELADGIRRTLPGFDADGFVADAAHQLDTLGLNARMSQIADALERYLPADFPTAVRALIAALGDEEPVPGSTDWDGFIVIPQCEFITRRGRGHYDEAMTGLYWMTRRFSAEGHLRVFLEVDYAQTMARLRTWARDPNPHVRRLVSEGTRPRLPMTPRIRRFVEDPTPLFALLSLLREDPSDYVLRSVANNLNDISKDHPERVLDVLEAWQEVDNPGTQWLVRHASRTLMKAGSARAMRLHGYATDPLLEVALDVETPSCVIGSEVRFAVTLTSTAAHPQRLLLDYVVDFVKANGGNKPKVFKWTERLLAPGERVRLQRRQHLRETSGRRLYPGTHRLGLQICGQRFGDATFEVRG